MLKHEYMTTNNIVLAVALMLGMAWAYSSVQAMQRNFTLQREVDAKRREATLVQLQTQTLEFEQRYYKSTEYLSLEAKRRLGLAEPGEHLLILPPNTQNIVDSDKKYAVDYSATPAASTESVSNMQQWINFLSGSQAKALQKNE